MSYHESKKVEIPLDLIYVLNEIDNERAGVLLKNILNYANGFEIKETDKIDRICFIPVKRFINDNNILRRKTYVYIIKLSDKNESFIKIGVSCDLEKRYVNFRHIGYDVEEMCIYENQNRPDALEMEKYYHNKLKTFKYIPIIDFAGGSECFKLICLNSLGFKGGKDE